MKRRIQTIEALKLKRKAPVDKRGKVIENAIIDNIFMAFSKEGPVIIVIKSPRKPACPTS